MVSVDPQIYPRPAEDNWQGAAGRGGEVPAMKTFFVAALLFVTTSAWADAVLTGTVREVQVGDYYHLVIRDGKGKDHSFFVGNHKSFDGIVEKPESFKGKKVRVHWHTVEKEIPEAGGKMKIDEATSLEFLK